MRKRIILNKKAQGRIGETFTWFVGFLIVTFTMIILVIASTAFAGSKRITDGWDKIELENYGVEKLRIQRVLIGLLNTNSELDGEEISVKNLIVKFDLDNSEKEKIREKIKEEADKIFSEFEECYTIVIDTNNQGEAIEDKIIRLDNFEIIFYDRPNRFIEADKQKLLKSGIIFPLVLDNKDIRLKFYNGECIQ